MRSIKHINRRDFLAGATVACASVLASTPIVSSAGQRWKSDPSFAPARSSFFDLIRSPDFITAYEGPTSLPLARSSGVWVANGITVHADPQTASTEHSPTSLSIALSAADKPLSRIHLRWSLRVASWLRFLGDHWERGYGDLEWRGLVGERVMPWYFMAHDSKHTHGYGVAVQPNAMVFWRVDNAGVSLWLDVRNGGSPVVLGERTLELCSVVTREGREVESPWQATRAFCALMCRAPRMPAVPVYGGNNWYYAYGKSSAREIERDASIMSELAGTAKNRPFQVIDDGWQVASSGSGCCSGGPWHYSNSAFPDMPRLAERIKTLGVRPGIWMRPLLTQERGLESWTLHAPHDGGQVLDPTIPEARERIRSDVAELVAWGYELVKHDFSTYDLFLRWGRAMGTSLTNDGWAFADRSRTSAEVIKDLYRAVRKGAGEHTLVIGCNTIGHLAAGLFELQRTGDDTSGKNWDQTRRMGVNTLAFRGVQHGTFFAADADCIGLTTSIPWSLNKQWLDLLSHSGTPLFVSAAPDAVGAEQRKSLREAFARAAIPHAVAEPLDWLDTTTPARWRCEGEILKHDWYGAKGIESVESR